MTKRKPAERARLLAFAWEATDRDLYNGHKVTGTAEPDGEHITLSLEGAEDETLPRGKMIYVERLVADLRGPDA